MDPSSVMNKLHDHPAMSVSVHTEDKATKAKMVLENYYSNLIEQHWDRQNRFGFSFLWKIFLGSDRKMQDF